MSITVYKLIHLIGVAMILVALGGLSLHAISGGEKAHEWRRPAMMTHGFGLLVSLVGGFGMLARLGIHWPWPGWVLFKFIAWLAFGGITMLLYRKQGLNRLVWWGSLALFTAVAYVALNKPF
jgi:hypothetical protein